MVKGTQTMLNSEGLEIQARDLTVIFTSYRSLCIAEAPVVRDIQGRSSSPQANLACSCTNKLMHE